MWALKILYVFSSSQSASVNRICDALHGQFRKADSEQHQLKISFLNLGQVVGRHTFIDQTNIERTSTRSRHVQNPLIIKILNLFAVTGMITHEI